MSKQLPYFQFEPAEWLTGDVSICSLEAQGLFVNIKCLYWQKDCKLSLSQVKKRYKYDDALQELIDEDIIKIKDDNIIIEFLDEQRTALLRRRQTNSKNGRKGALKRIENQKVSKPSSSEADATPKHLEEKRIEENILDNNTPDKSGGDIVVKSDKIDWSKLLDLFNTTFNKKSRVINDTVKKSFKARLKDYTRDDVIVIMNRIKDDKFHVENNFKYVTLEYIARPNTFDKYISMVDEKPAVSLSMNL